MFLLKNIDPLYFNLAKSMNMHTLIQEWKMCTLIQTIEIQKIVRGFWLFKDRYDKKIY